MGTLFSKNWISNYVYIENGICYFLGSKKVYERLPNSWKILVLNPSGYRWEKECLVINQNGVCVAYLFKWWYPCDKYNILVPISKDETIEHEYGIIVPKDENAEKKFNDFNFYLYRYINQKEREKRISMRFKSVLYELQKEKELIKKYTPTKNKKAKKTIKGNF